MVIGLGLTEKRRIDDRNGVNMFDSSNSLKQKVQMLGQA